MVRALNAAQKERDFILRECEDRIEREKRISGRVLGNFSAKSKEDFINVMYSTIHHSSPYSVLKFKLFVHSASIKSI